MCMLRWRNNQRRKMWKCHFGDKFTSKKVVVVLVRVDYQKKNNKKLLKGLETIRVIYSGKVWRSSTHAVFNLSGQINLHNCFYYAMENPHKTCVKLLKICFLAKITFDYGLVHQVIDGTVTAWWKILWSSSKNYCPIHSVKADIDLQTRRGFGSFQTRCKNTAEQKSSRSEDR